MKELMNSGFRGAFPEIIGTSPSFSAQQRVRKMNSIDTALGPMVRLVAMLVLYVNKWFLNHEKKMRVGN